METLNFYGKQLKGQIDTKFYLPEMKLTYRNLHSQSINVNYSPKILIFNPHQKDITKMKS